MFCRVRVIPEGNFMDGDVSFLVGYYSWYLWLALLYSIVPVVPLLAWDLPFWAVLIARGTGGGRSRVSRFTLSPRNSRLSAELVVSVLVQLLRLVRVPEIPECVVNVGIALSRGILSSLSIV